MYGNHAEVEARAYPKSVNLILLVEPGTHHLIKVHLRLGLLEFGSLYHLAHHLSCLELGGEFHLYLQ